MKSLRCGNSECPLLGKARAGKIIRHGFYRTKWGRRRRFRCRACGKTFCTSIQTPYHRLQHRRATFDEVAALSVEGLNKSAIARVKRIAWNTVDRWLTRAAQSCHRFNDRKITGVAVEELQADEIRTIVGGKKQPFWIFASIDVWSRLWPSTVVGRRSYRNTLTLFRDVANRMNLSCFPMIATDGFEFYEKVVRRVFGPACLYGQVIKTRRNDRVVRVERRTKFGAPWRWEQALRDSEDSKKLNTSFIERLNLTIRQGSAYLCRRTICYARCKERLAAHLELLRCYYNFVRPHRALQFGREVRTPAVQAGLTTRRITLREIFSSATILLVWKKVTCVFVYFAILATVDDKRRPVAA
jgi:transposase-like protein/IS1 family transposase